MEPINIIYQTAEDGLADTIKPRLEDAGADCSKILVIDESEKDLTINDSRIEAAIRQTNAKMIIFDPIQAFLGRNVDINRANETRAITKKLGAIAERTGCAIILVGHMNKGSGVKAAYRGLGSIDFYAVVRSVLLIGRVPNNPDIRAIAHIKGNLAPLGKTMAFQLGESGFAWMSQYEITADELLGNNDYPRDAKFQEAVKFLTSLYEKGNTYSATEIAELGAQEDIKMRTLSKAKKALGIESVRNGNSWNWMQE